MKDEERENLEVRLERKAGIDCKRSKQEERRKKSLCWSCSLSQGSCGLPAKKKIHWQDNGGFIVDECSFYR